MTDLAPAESADTGSDDFDAEFDAAREAEYDAPDEGGEEQAEDPAPAAKRDPLPAEELEKRYRNAQAAMKQEREARRALENKLREFEAQRQAAAPDQQVSVPEVVQPPGSADDPIGTLDWLVDLALRGQQTEAERQRNEAEQQRINSHIADTARWGGTQEVEFRAEKPDYDKAARHFADARLQELSDEGYAPNELEAQFHKELLDLTNRARKAGKNPAEMVYALATRRGYKADSAASPVAEKLERVARGQEQSRSLSSSGGRPASSGAAPTMESVSKLKGAAFDQAFAALKAAEKRRA